MDRKKIFEINKERLTGWLHRCTEQHSTPQILIGVGHDHVSGRILVLAPENGPSDIELLMFMKNAVTQMEQNIAQRN